MALWLEARAHGLETESTLGRVGVHDDEESDFKVLRIHLVSIVTLHLGDTLYIFGRFFPNSFGSSLNESGRYPAPHAFVRISNTYKYSPYIVIPSHRNREGFQQLIALSTYLAFTEIQCLRKHNHGLALSHVRNQFT